MLEEFRGQTFVDAVFLSQLESDAHHVQAKETHPASGVRLLEDRAVRQLGAAVYNGDVVEAEETSLENVQTLAINFVDPPGKIDQQLVKTFLEELAVTRSCAFLLEFVNSPRGPRLHRWVQIRKFPFVRGNLPVGVLELLEEEH